MTAYMLVLVLSPLLVVAVLVMQAKMERQDNRDEGIVGFGIWSSRKDKATTLRELPRLSARDDAR